MADILPFKRPANVAPPAPLSEAQKLGKFLLANHTKVQYLMAAITLVGEDGEPEAHLTFLNTNQYDPCLTLFDCLQKAVETAIQGPQGVVESPA